MSEERKMYFSIDHVVGFVAGLLVFVCCTLVFTYGYWLGGEYHVTNGVLKENQK